MLLVISIKPQKTHAWCSPVKIIVLNKQVSIINVFITEFIFRDDPKSHSKIPWAYCQGNQCDANFWVGQQKCVFLHSSIAAHESELFCLSRGLPVMSKCVAYNATHICHYSSIYHWTEITSTGSVDNNCTHWTEMVPFIIYTLTQTDWQTHTDTDTHKTTDTQILW